MTADTPVEPSDEELSGRRGLIDALDAEVNRQLASVESRAQSMSTRASILVGAASIVTGLQLPEASASSAWFLWAIAAAAFAAVLGVVVLLPGRGTEVPVLEAERDFWNSTESRAVWVLSHWKLGSLKAQETRLKVRAVILVTGFAALGASLSLSFLYLLTAALGESHG